MEKNVITLSAIRKYPVEIMVYLLCFAVTSFSYAIYKLNEKIDLLQVEQKNYLNTDRQLLIETVQKNTAVMDRAIIVIEKQNEK